MLSRELWTEVRLFDLKCFCNRALRVRNLLAVRRFSRAWSRVKFLFL